MSVTLVPVPFVDDRLSITLEECSPKFMDHLKYQNPLSLREFANSGYSSVYEVEETGPFLFESPDGAFARGPVVS